MGGGVTIYIYVYVYRQTYIHTQTHVIREMCIHSCMYAPSQPLKGLRFAIRYLYGGLMSSLRPFLSGPGTLTHFSGLDLLPIIHLLSRLRAQGLGSQVILLGTRLQGFARITDSGSQCLCYSAVHATNLAF